MLHGGAVVRGGGIHRQASWEPRLPRPSSLDRSPNWKGGGISGDRGGGEWREPDQEGGPCLGTMLGDEWVLEEGRGGAEFVNGQCSSAVFLFRSSGLHWGRGRRVNHFPLRAGPWTIDQSESEGPRL